jgi:hypothetical protein
MVEVIAIRRATRRAGLAFMAFNHGRKRQGGKRRPHFSAAALIFLELKLPGGH